MTKHCPDCDQEVEPAETERHAVQGPRIVRDIEVYECPECGAWLGYR